MADYKKMYYRLFNAMTDAVNVLQAAQIETEEMFISQKETEIVVLDKPNDE